MASAHGVGAWRRRMACREKEAIYGNGFSGIASMLLGWLVGRALKLSEVDTIVCITVAGGGAVLAGLAYLWIADITTGQSGSLMWLVVGFVGGMAGVITYLLTRYADWVVGFLKRNGLL